MTVLQRAATFAAMTFSLVGLLGNSSPGRATDLDRKVLSALQTAAPSAANPLLPAVVPVDAAAVAPQAPVNQAKPATYFVQQLPTQTVADDGADDEFDTLADAVAAQDGADVTDAERCLAGAIYFEAKGEPLAGQLAVANVIINRTKSGRFPSDVCAVVKQRGQFAFVRGGQIPTIDQARAAYRTAIAVAKVAMDAAWDSPAPQALYFNTPNRRPGGNLTKIAMIGNHVFYR
ncbi:MULTISPECIES: cell wall hydrolase [Sphingomonas]|jgi:N-acetylmuramoyl-L-alanine amidase|uniref:cell wall hydrolase n=1 Tax=Sphingomonas TaxID=13687 RepID=UPI00193C016D|nr:MULTISPECIES: cell wall hydrolase [Sphingomonas]